MRLEFDGNPNRDSLRPYGRPMSKSPLKCVDAPKFERRCHRICWQSISDATPTTFRESRLWLPVRGVFAQLLGFGGKPPSLIVGESKTSTTHLLPKNAIFLVQILDDLLLPFI